MMKEVHIRQCWRFIGRTRRPEFESRRRGCCKLVDRGGGGGRGGGVLASY